MNLVLRSSCIGLGLLAAAPASAAALQQLAQSEWWGGQVGLPSYVNMYLYVPDTLAPSPPIVVAPHHCQGTGPGTFGEMSSLVARANQEGFILIFPEATGQNCWDAGSTRSLTHDGKGDTHAIVQMVRYTLAKYAGNAARVYSVGGSSGGMITEALLGVYPDVFMAGVSYMGVPSGCWAQGYNDVVGKPANGTGQWSGPCAAGNVVKTAQEWGDLARSFFPGYAGHHPRLQHWHGTADTTISPKNLAEDIKQWTNVLGLSETPSGSDTPANSTTHQYWMNACGYTVYETFSLAGVGHAVPFDGNAVAAYFGLQDAAGTDPETAACPAAIPGSLGSGGASGSGGSGAISSGDAPLSAGSAGAGTRGTINPMTDLSGGAATPVPANGPGTGEVSAAGAEGAADVAPGTSQSAGLDGDSSRADSGVRDATRSACEFAGHANDRPSAATALLAALGLLRRRRAARRSGIVPR